MSIFDLIKKRNTDTKSEPIPPSNNDIYYTLSKQTQEHLKNGQLGLYRNDLFNMSEVLRKGKKYEGQLQLLIIVFYIDMFGYSDLDTYQLAKSKEYKILPPSPMIAPRIANNIRICAKNLGMSDEQLHTFFLNNLRENIVPTNILTIDECFSVWQMWMQDDNPQKLSANAFLEKKVKAFIKRK